MANSAVSNTGPILHLFEIRIIKVLDIFSQVQISKEVEEELKKYRINISKKIEVISLEDTAKDTVKLLTNQYNLDLGEASAISLALQQKAGYFLTDDLDARDVASKYGIEVHGTIGLILRAFRKRILNKEDALLKVHELKSKSSLFITQDLIAKVIMAIEEFSIRK